MVILEKNTSKKNTLTKTLQEAFLIFKSVCISLLPLFVAHIDAAHQENFVVGHSCGDIHNWTVQILSRVRMLRSPTIFI